MSLFSINLFIVEFDLFFQIKRVITKKSNEQWKAVNLRTFPDGGGKRKKKYTKETMNNLNRQFILLELFTSLLPPSGASSPHA